MKTHKAGIHVAFLVKRKVKLTGLANQELVALTTEIESLKGIDQIEFDVERGLMKASYDASITNIDIILETLKQHSIEPSKGWWNRYKLDWDRQIDQNVRENAKHEPHCCSKPPAGH